MYIFLLKLTGCVHYKKKASTSTNLFSNCSLMETCFISSLGLSTGAKRLYWLIHSTHWCCGQKLYSSLYHINAPSATEVLCSILKGLSGPTTGIQKSYILPSAFPSYTPKISIPTVDKQCWFCNLLTCLTPQYR